MDGSIGLLCLTVLSAISGSIHYDWNISAEDVRVDGFCEWDVISLNGGMPVFSNGFPNLPGVPRCYVIPQGTTVFDVQATNITTVSLGRMLLPMPVMLLPFSGEVTEFPDYTDEGFANIGEKFPLSPISGFKTGTKTGFRLGSFTFVPFVYNELNGELLLVTSADIDLYYRYDMDAPLHSLTEGQVSLARRGLGTFVNNPEMLDVWSPTSRSGIEGDVEVLIIAHDQYASQLSELVSLHETMGYSSESVTVEWIIENSEGYDSREQIRNHIIDLYQNNGLLFVVICGDREIPFSNGLTVRLSRLEFPYWSEMMSSTSDLYFSDLDGTWDDNGNHLYGEEDDGMDLYSDVYVGRYPASLTQADELNAMIGKTVQYNTAPLSGEWQKHALLMGAVSFPNLPSGPWRFQSKYCDSLATFLPEDWTWDKVYEDTTGSHPNNQLELFNQGTALTAYGAHGGECGFFWYYPYPQWPPIMNCDTIQYMTNGGMLPWVLGSNSCATGKILHNGFAESLFEYPEGGAIIVSASSESSFGGSVEPGPGGWLGIYFAHVLFEQGLVTAGVAHGISKDMFWANWNSFYIPRMAEWCLQALNLYGDPCTVFIGAPEGMESTPSAHLNIRISPNPVCQTMEVRVTLPMSAAVRLSVYDVTGRIVMLDEFAHPGGEQTVALDLSTLATGMYMVNAVAGYQTDTVKCMVLR